MSFKRAAEMTGCRKPGFLSVVVVALMACVIEARFACAADTNAPQAISPGSDPEPMATDYAASRNALDVWRVYTGEDGTSHLERAQLPAKFVPFFGPDKGLFKVGALEVRKDSKVYIPSRSARIMLYSAPGDLTLPEHPSPGSEMFLILRGHASLVLRDGTEHEFGPGDIVILEDKTGPGHGTRIGPDGFTALNFSFPTNAPIGALTRKR